MNNYIEPLLFVAVLILIALISWLVRTFLESNPAPLLSNFTFFAFAGQCILTPEQVREGIPNGTVFGLLLVGLCLLLFQVLTIRAQAQKTLEHYTHLLEENRVGNLPSDQIKHWAELLLHITDVDFFPEFYAKLIDFNVSPLQRRRNEAIWILSANQFRLGPGGITPDSLLVPREERRLLWRLYVAICFLSWNIFIMSIFLARPH